MEKQNNGVVKTLGVLKGIKTILIIALTVAVAALAIWIILDKEPEPIDDGGSIPEGIREISELATLEYRYKEVIALTEEEEFKLFGLWDVDPGERILIVQYNGIIKLGIDFGEIQVNEHPADQEGKKKFEIKLPDVKIISSETPQDSFEVIFEKGVYTDENIAMEDFFGTAAERQTQRDNEVLSGELAETALENAKTQIEALIKSTLGLDANYEIAWF